MKVSDFQAPVENRTANAQIFGDGSFPLSSSGATRCLRSLLIGASRLYVGVHWPSDLLVGWVVGVVTVLVVHRVYAGVTSWSRHRLRRIHC